METTVKRRFYGKGEAKDFTRKAFYNAVIALVDGNTDDIDLDLVKAAAEFELETLTLASAKKGGSKATGERKDPLQSDYANAIREAIYPLLGKEPLTSGELAVKATAKGLIAPTGKPFQAGWISRVLKGDGKAKIVEKMVTTTTKDGGTHTDPKDAYVAG